MYPVQIVKTITYLMNRHTINLINFLKVCFAILTLTLVSCGDESGNKKQVTTTTTTEDMSVAQDSSTKKILFFGDSITAGYGLDDMQNAFPGVLQQRIDSLGLNYTVINSGVSGETTAGGRSRINWILNQEIDVFILELGANDGLRGVAVDETKANLQYIINAVQKKDNQIEIVLAGMQLPPNLGQDYTRSFRQIFPELAQSNDIHLIPFILKDVGGVAALNQSDGIHPTAAGHKILAQNVWQVLGPLLKK